MTFTIGWRQSYKKRVSKDLKASFHLLRLFFLVIPLGFKPKTFRTGI